MIVGAYTLNLYCRNRDEPWRDYVDMKEPAEFAAEHGSNARQQARWAGWRLDLRANEATCPKCVKEGR
jgi:hypothetical protein